MAVMGRVLVIPKMTVKRELNQRLRVYSLAALRAWTY